MTGRSWHHQKPAGPFDVIVIGSGIGGLIAANALARHGSRKVLVLEQHYRVGGFTHVFTRPGFEWDVGVHYVGGVGPTGPLRALFDTSTDGALEWAPLPAVYDVIELGSRRYELEAGARAFITRLTQAFPGERDAITAYVELVVTTARRNQVHWASRMTRPRVTGGLASGHRLERKPDVSHRTTLDVLRELTSNEMLIGVLTGQYGDYGMPPALSAFGLHAAVVEHYLDGAFYPVGGSARLASTLVPGIETAGGHVASSAEVAQLLIERDRVVGVRMADGTALRAPLVISNAGVRRTFEELVPQAHRPPEVLELLAKIPPSSPYLCLYVGLDRTDAELGLTGTNLWLYPDEHHDENVRRFAMDPNAPFPMLYVSFPSAKDPDFQRRCPGRSTVQVITMARWEWFEAWSTTKWKRRPESYEALKQTFSKRLLDALIQRLPQLDGHVVWAELSTPLSTAHFSGHRRGETYGLASVPERLKLPVHVETALPGLLLTGADVITAGVGGAAFAGVLTAAAVLGPRVIGALMKKGFTSPV
ncbi:MAG: NAD(P)/FAD-dependent oxidoreductase [Myxococcaceae bacterium]